MTAMLLQYLAVAAIVALAAHHAWRRLAPRRRRTIRIGSAAERPAAGCGSCNGCGGCPPGR